MGNDRFIRLLTRQLSDGLTEAEQEELRQLLQDNKEYRDQKELLEQYWQKDQARYAVNAAMFKKVMDKIGAPEEQRTRTRFTAGYSAAAALLLAVAGIFFFYHSAHVPAAQAPPHQVAWLQKSTKPTVKTTMTLSDGTMITLNAATTLIYPDTFAASTREVYLDGEAYFDVAKDAQHPFIIHANKMNIRVLGTAFNIKSYLNEQLSEATLIKGSIEVTLNDRPSDRIILKPKEKLVVQNNTQIKKQAAPAARDTNAKDTRYSLTNLTYFRNKANTVVETSWVENKLVFSNQDFSQLSGQLERWYGVHIEFANEQVKQYRFTGLFEKETLPEALNVLRMIEHFNYKIKDSTVHIY
jgi:transmembrane sensor